MDAITWHKDSAGSYYATRTYARAGKRLTASALQAECRLSWDRAARVFAIVDGGAA